MRTKILVMISMSLFMFSAHSIQVTSDCVDCGRKTNNPETMPDKTVAMDLQKAVTTPIDLASKGPLVITKKENFRAPAGDVESGQPSRVSYQTVFCNKFSQIEWQSLATMITKEMEATPYKPIDDYFKTAACQASGYSDAVKSPLIHIVADDPSKRENFLNVLWMYYSKKRNDPAQFTEVVNAKNSKGETLLDYFESMGIKGQYKNEKSEPEVSRMVAMLCSHGAVYATHPEKKCP